MKVTLTFAQAFGVIHAAIRDLGVIPQNPCQGWSVDYPRPNLPASSCHQIAIRFDVFSRYVSQNVFLKMYFPKCIPQNVFSEMR